MKSRSEVLKERQEKKASGGGKKSSAEERTKPIPGLGPDDKVTCEACEEESLVSKLEKRDDGSFECPHCAAPIEVKVGKKKATKEEPEDETDEEEEEDDEDAPSSSKAEASEDEEDDDEEDEEEEEQPKAKSKKDETPKDGTRSGVFCGECGAEWPYLKGKPHKNCGHKADGIDDPRRATEMAKVSASGAVNDSAPKTSTQPVPQVALSGNRMSIAWGKTSFPVGESKGFKFSNMEIPNQIITVDIPEGADRIEMAKKILDDLEKIAELAFDRQYKWYLKKLDKVTE